MRIVIDTDGSSEGTIVSFGDKLQKDLVEFNFSVRINGRAKMQLTRMDEAGKCSPQSFYAGDFEKWGTEELSPGTRPLGSARKTS